MSPASTSRRGWILQPYSVRREKAPGERGQTIQWLRKKGKSPEALKLAEKLEGCRPFSRCGSGACKVCSTIAQEHLGRAIVREVRQRGVGQSAFTLTLVTDAEATPVGNLRGYDAKNHLRRLRRLMHQLPISWAVGGLDLSLNEDREGRYQPHWSPHAYFVGITDDHPLLKQQLGGLVEASDRVPRPSLLMQLRGGPKPYLYVLKPDFIRRVGRMGVGHVRRTGELRPCRTTDPQRLRSAERLELLLFLDQLSLQKRIIGLRCQVHQKQRSYRIRRMP